MLRISVVIPTYRRPDLLLKCIGALGNQDIPASDFEIIVVSDGPDDATAAALANLPYQPANLRFLPMPKKGGPAAARNYGWQHAQAALIAFTDDDTIPSPLWLSGYLQAWDGSALAAFTGKVVVPLPPHPTDFAQNTAGLETADFVTANCACTKQALLKVGGFDERFAMAWREDSDLHFKLLQANIPLRKIEEAMIVHPVREAPWGVSIKEQKKTLFNALLYKKFPELYQQQIQARPPVTYYVMVVSFFAAIITLLAGHTITALILFTIWLMFTLQFTLKRLAHTSHSAPHIYEMLYTSAVIPFASVYWHFYGCWKYGVWFG
ncbi:glycosyltransferase [Mucilaginibacter sp. Bleaf8]|uniref:glycosyltransferase family 2 protein n=1 Tax=Mucilaginibacter sp. Bleaf8 TaxID=2834430 RepID=UPI001BCEE630|nr:glycosyltransferase [Mucilaginibacter sp. Bleaf8]MBS7565012.1 glycosyltransferase [Mucilaginibacter sp. Bleaf8]